MQAPRVATIRPSPVPAEREEFPCGDTPPPPRLRYRARLGETMLDLSILSLALAFAPVSQDSAPPSTPAAAASQDSPTVEQLTKLVGALAVQSAGKSSLSVLERLLCEKVAGALDETG
jgi:hypothetical protein